MSTRAKTPGYNCHLGIFFDLDRNGRRRAYRWSPMQFRAFPMPLDEADAHIAQGHATQLPFHPMKGPRG